MSSSRPPLAAVLPHQGGVVVLARGVAAVRPAEEEKKLYFSDQAKDSSILKCKNIYLKTEVLKVKKQNNRKQKTDIIFEATLANRIRIHPQI